MSYVLAVTRAASSSISEASSGHKIMCHEQKDADRNIDKLISLYIMNRIGPRKDRWGTPHDTAVVEDYWDPWCTACVPLDKYDHNHWCADLSKPYDNCKRCSSMLWSTALKAADMSNSANTANSRLSTAWRQSHNTYSMIVQSLCSNQKSTVILRIPAQRAHRQDADS